MKKKNIFTVMFIILMLVIAFLLFKYCKDKPDTSLKKVTVAEPTLT